MCDTSSFLLSRRAAKTRICLTKGGSSPLLTKQLRPFRSCINISEPQGKHLIQFQRYFGCNCSANYLLVPYC